MFRKKIELTQLKSILYPEDIQVKPGCAFGIDNRLYRSLIKLFEAFWIYGKKELYLVGGCVRDMLLGKKPKDYDLCTNATPDEVKEIISTINLKSFDSGIKHGTLTIIDDFYQMNYEITTYRIDGKYTDGRHPDEVVFTPSLEEDLKRRDFTINSFAYDLLRCEVLALDESYFDDLKYGIIRTVGDPIDRFNEDALRMLRALRFAAQLKFFIEASTYEAIKRLAPNMEKISKERIRDELTKILLSDNIEILEQFVDTDMERYCFDGSTPIGNMLHCQHNCNWHYTDVLHHTMLVVNRVPKTFILRWAALLHDVGKPTGRHEKFPGSGRYDYHGHPDVSVQIAEPFMDMLKFSNDQKDLILKFVKHHDLDLSMARNGTFKKFLAEIGPENFNDFMKLQVADAYAHTIKDSIKWNSSKITKTYARFTKVINEKQPLTVADLAINGYDLMNLGLQGKQVGDCLAYLTEEVLEDASKNDKQRLLAIARDWRDSHETTRR